MGILSCLASVGQYLFVWFLLYLYPPNGGGHNSEPIRDNQLNDVRCMPPKYDLILRQDGEIKIKQIMAIDINDVIAKGKLERSDLKGVVFSDKNEENYK